MKNTKEIKLILEQLEKAVEKDTLKEKKSSTLKTKKRLNESELLHVALHVWENVNETSHDWHISPSELMRMCASVLFGAAIYKMDLKKIWKKILSISKEKVKKLLDVVKIITSSKTYEEAKNRILKVLGIDVQPKLGLVESYRKK